VKPLLTFDRVSAPKVAEAAMPAAPSEARLKNSPPTVREAIESLSSGACVAGFGVTMAGRQGVDRSGRS